MDGARVRREDRGGAHALLAAVSAQRGCERGGRGDAGDGIRRDAVQAGQGWRVEGVDAWDQQDVRVVRASEGCRDRR